MQPRQGSTPALCVSEALASRPSIDRSYVTFLSCTDNDIDVAYLKELDKSAQNVDEVRMTILLLHQLGFSIPVAELRMRDQNVCLESFAPRFVW